MDIFVNLIYEALMNLKLAKKGIVPISPLRRINHLLATGHITTVVNNTIKVYYSICTASIDIGINDVTILKYINN